MFVVGWNQFQFTVFHTFQRTCRHTGGVDKPLRFQPGFHNVATAGTDGQLHRVVFGATVQPQVGQLCQNLFPRVKSHRAGKSIATVDIDRTTVVQDVDRVQPVALATFVIVGVVGGRDFHGTGTKRHVHQHVVQDQWNCFVRVGLGTKRMNQPFAVQVFVTGVFRVHGHGRVAKHGFQTGGGHDDFFVQAFDFVGKRNDHPKFIFMVQIVPGHFGFQRSTF